MVEVKQENAKELRLTEEGEACVRNGSYEVNLFNAIPDEGVSQASLMVGSCNSHQLV